MKNTSEFLVLRYSLVEEVQQSLYAEPLPEPKGASVLVALMGDREFIRYKVRYALVGFSVVEPTKVYRFQSGRYVVGKVAKLRTARVGEKVPGDIIKHEADDWIPLIAIFDLQEQFIFIQRDWKFGTEAQISSALQTGIRGPVLSKYNYRVFVEPKTKTAEFWSVVEAHKRIFRLEIELISPNILRTNEKAREALEELKKLYAQDEISIALENESGNLEVPEDPIADYIAYASEGEGKWRLVTEGEKGGKKKHTSEKAAISVELPVPTEEEIHHEGQLELETGSPAPGRKQSDASLIAQVISESEKLTHQSSDD